MCINWCILGNALLLIGGIAVIGIIATWIVDKLTD